MSEFHEGSLNEYCFLVTGGAGFIGSHIVEYLLKNGAGKVRVLDNLSTGSIKNTDLFSGYPNYEFIEGDIRDSHVCKKACIGIDYISHQAALGSVPRSINDPITSNEVNVNGFVNMLVAAKDANVRSFVYASSSSVYGDEPNLPKREEKVGNCLSPYAVTKKTNELYADVFAKLYDMKLIGYRYFNVFGPRQDPHGPYAAVIPLFIDGILNGTPTYINGDGEQTRDFTFVDNAVQANIKGMLNVKEEAFGKVYNVAVGENYSVNYLYNEILRLLEKKSAPIYREARPGDVRNSLADISKAKDLLNYKPSKHFREGLQQTVKFFQEYYLPEKTL